MMKGENNSNCTKFITCPNFVRKLLAMFRDVTATSSLDLSAWAIAKAPSSCESDKYDIRHNIFPYEPKVQKEHIHTLISLNPKSREVKASLTTFKLRARHCAPCDSWFIKQWHHKIERRFECKKEGKITQGTENKLHLLVHLLVSPKLIWWYCILKHLQWTVPLLLLSVKVFCVTNKSYYRPSTGNMHGEKVTWHQPSLRVFMFPWNLRTSAKALAPSGPMGL